jgi:hypothetical protein
MPFAGLALLQLRMRNWDSPQAAAALLTSIGRMPAVLTASTPETASNIVNRLSLGRQAAVAKYKMYQSDWLPVLEAGDAARSDEARTSTEPPAALLKMLPLGRYSSDDLRADWPGLRLASVAEDASAEVFWSAVERVKPVQYLLAAPGFVSDCCAAGPWFALPSVAVCRR